jgi:hypothetical protein
MSFPTASAATPAAPIWVNEQIDPCGIIYCCIACTSEDQAKACHESFKDNLTVEQRASGWIAQVRKVTTWDEVPVAALKLG